MELDFQPSAQEIAWRKFKSYCFRKKRVLEFVIHGITIRDCHRRGGQLDKIVQALLSGISSREAARSCNASKATAFKIRKQIVAQRGEIFCACGQKSDHNGWCQARFEKSPKRQAVISKLKQRAYFSSRATA